ncbi:N2227-like protein-domain-containing protein [Syncephalis fuscata]|nr:N2227-like protein-domain-containing protein [Syncephalis fuscata]
MNVDEETKWTPAVTSQWDAYHGHNHGHDSEDKGRAEEDDTVAEQRVFRRTLMAMVGYRRHSMNVNQRRRREWHLLPERHRSLMPSYEEKLNRIDTTIEANAQFLRLVASHACQFSDGDSQVDTDAKYEKTPSVIVAESDIDKVRSTLKQVVRDWTVEGEMERTATYSPIMKALEDIYGAYSMDERAKLRVLVPGAGLGRLAYDIAKQGTMLIKMLYNSVERVGQHEIYPFVHVFSNIRDSQDMLKSIAVPDVLPSNLPPNVDFSMVAGEFIEVYDIPEQYGSWDCIVTCYFIDTAHNIIEYLETIRKLLKPNGCWINYGPLLYHWEGVPGERSVELSLDELMQVIRTMGFTIKDETMCTATYAANPDSMLKYTYNNAFFIARP